MTYTLAGADEGKAIKVRVFFTDDAGNGETLTSAATDAVAGLPSPPLTASLENAPGSHDGVNTFTFELRFSEEFSLSYKTLRDHAFETTGGQVVGARRLESEATSGGRSRWSLQARGMWPLPCRSPPTAPTMGQSARRTAGPCPTGWSSPSPVRANR